MSTSNELEPLQGLLNTILSRLENIELKVGIEDSATPPLSAAAEEVGPSAAVIAYKEHIKNYVEPFCKSCDELKGLDDISKPIYKAFNDNIGNIIELASLCPKPIQATASITKVLQPYIKPVQDSIAEVQKYRLDREYDYHYKAITEMMCICSWVVVEMPPPGTYIRESIGSCDYWGNKIRKQYKGDAGGKPHIVFCDTMKAMMLDIMKYVKEYHLNGVSFNLKGKCKTLADADVYLKKKAEGDDSSTDSGKSSEKVAGDGIQNELLSIISGDSAATGLKKVTRDQQTCRKEFKKPASDMPTHPQLQPSATTKASTAVTAKAQPKPKMELLEMKQKWIIEYQTAATTTGNTLTIDVTNPKQQIYIYKCSNVTITIKNKFNTVVFDSCTKCNLIFETAISSCEVVNCKSTQIQTLGLCPSFTIDKTDSCLIYLSEETKNVSTFVTSKSSEMNVSYPDGNGEMKEIPIPEQFFHKLNDNGVGLSTRVSDLYH